MVKINSKTNNQKVKLPLRKKINVAIFAVIAIIFAVLPNTLFMSWINVDDNKPDYADNFPYVLHDICPCHTGEDDCSEYYACGADKANITYNLDTAPEDKLEEAKRDTYFENMIESNRHSVLYARVMTLCDISYIIAFLSLVVGIIYWNHNKA